MASVMLQNGIAFAKDTSLTVVSSSSGSKDPTDAWYSCQSAKECLLTEGYCFRIASINEKFKDKFEQGLQLKEVVCGSYGDAESIKIYKPICVQQKCGMEFNIAKADEFYLEWKKKVNRYLVLVHDFEDVQSSTADYNKLKNYFNDYIVVYVDSFDKYQQQKKNEDAEIDFFNLVSEGAGFHGEKLSEISANVYLKSPDRFKRVFKKAKLKDVELFCKRTRVGLEAKKIMPGDIRLKVLGEICKEQKS